MISVELKVVGGKHAGQSIPLDRKKFLIGREQDCQLRPNSELVSRHHCVFTVDDYSVRLRDLGSTNGTSVNGETIRKEVVLQQGDEVTVGSLEFQIAINEAVVEAATQTTSAETEETMVAGADTLSEMKSIQPMEDVIAGAPTTTAPAEAPTVEQPAAAPEQVVAAQPAPAAPTEIPPAAMGDTTMISHEALLQGQTPYQPMMPQQQMGYPMYGNQPYPGMPGQPMPMQQPYPGQPYPSQPYPPQPYPGQQFATQPQMPMQPAAPVAPQPAAVAAPADTAGAEATAEVSLPDPSKTGFKEPPPKPPAPKQVEGEGGGAGQEEPSNQSADAIIKQYMQKRPGG